MFRNQIQRVKSNLLPYIGIGLCIGIVIGKASWLRRIGWINDYLRFSNIDTYYPDTGQIIFFNHFDTSVLTFLLVALFTFSGLHRIVFGVHERGAESGGSINRSLENFGSLLAIAWLGLIVGISLPILIFQGVESCAKFFVYVVYPLLFLVEVSLGTIFLSGNSLRKLQGVFGRYNRWRLGTRLEGLVVVAIAILVLAFEDKHAAILKSFTVWVKSLF